MITVDDKHTAKDIQRLARTLWSYALFFALGFFICYYFTNDFDKTISCSCNYSVTCASPALEVKSYLYQPVVLPKTWIESAYNH